MKEELKIFFTAMMFYTRIPCPKWVDHSQEYLVKSVRYLPLIGWIVGALSGITFIAAIYFLPSTLSIALAMLTSILVTGAFHEDGLADVCDGFGGGWTKDKILTIMKDSRVGTYGVAGLVLVLLVKFLSLSTILQFAPTGFFEYPLFILAVFISGNSLSRFIALTTIVTHQYVRENDDSKAKPVVKQNLKWWDVKLIISAFFGIIPLVIFKTPLVFLLIIPMYLTKGLMLRFFKKWIGGYTGDCLGAVQQVSEVVFYIGFIILWKYI